MEKSNTAVWDAAFKTDPKYTKTFKRGGGFTGTAVNPTYLAKKATELFGPCGIGWGVRVLSEELVEGQPIFNDQNTLEGHVRIHKVHIEFWYKWGDESGTVEHFGQTEMVGVNKNGWFTDEEAPKKSLTDAMTKAMSLMGFAGDVHMGLYDDSKYVAEARAATPMVQRTAQDKGQITDMWKAAIAKADNEDRLQALKSNMAKLPEEILLALSPAWEARRKEVARGPV